MGFEVRVRWFVETYTTPRVVTVEDSGTTFDPPSIETKEREGWFAAEKVGETRFRIKEGPQAGCIVDRLPDSPRVRHVEG